MNKHFYSVLHTLGALVLGGGLLLCLTAILLAGGSLLELLLFWIAFILCLLGSGAFWVRKLLPSVQGPELLVLAFLPGCITIWAGYLMVNLLPYASDIGPLHLLPSVLLGGYELVHHLRTFKPATMFKTGLPIFAWAILVGTMGASLALYAVWGILPFAEANQLKAWVYNQDMLWSIGNAAAMRFGMPLTDIRAAGLTLNYHFFNDGVAGILAWGTGCSAWDGLCFYWYPPILLLSVLGLGLIGLRLTKNPYLAMCVAPVIYLFNPAQSTMATNLFTNANAQGTAILALCGTMLLIVNIPAIRSCRYGLLSFLIFAAAIMIKSPAGTLIWMALAAACLVGSFTKQCKSSHWYALCGATAAFCLVYLLVLSRATNNLVFTSLVNLIQLPAAYRLYFSIPVLLAYSVGLVYSLQHFNQLSLLQLTLNALAVGGILAYVLFDHYSFSQVYFALTAVPCAVLTSLPAVEALVDRLSSHPLCARVTTALVVLSLCACCLLQLYGGREYLRKGVQAALRCVNLRESEATELTVTDEDWEAALWLRENTDADAVFLSNRNNRQFAAADGIFHFYTAASQRQCLLESYRYGMDYDGSYWEIRRRLEQVSDAIYYQLSEQEAFAMAAQEQVDYIVVCQLVPNAPQWKREPVFSNQHVCIYAVTPTN